MGGYRYSSNANYFRNRRYNSNLFVLTINETTNKITNIRTLNTQIPGRNTHEFVNARAFNLDNGDIIIKHQDVAISETGTEGANNIGFLKLTIGTNTDTNVSLYYDSLYNYSNSTSYTPKTGGNPHVVYSYKLIKKTMYYYILSVVQLTGAATYKSIFKFPINNPTSGNHNSALTDEFQFNQVGLSSAIPFTINLLDNSSLIIRFLAGPQGRMSLFRQVDTLT